jgi:Zn-dependent M28 family amino/carboxypeptidase
MITNFTLKLLIIFFLFSGISFSQTGYSLKIDSILNLINIKEISLLERQLSGETGVTVNGNNDFITSRHYLSPANSLASQFIFETFQSYGYSPEYMNNSESSVNVYAKKTGTKFPNQYFIICSHYDDMPSYITDSTAPGADDNASGTTGVLIAAKLIYGFNTDYSILFITFDEEERGLYGSKAFADTAYARGDSIMGVINLDMIAYDGSNEMKMNLVTNDNSLSLANDYEKSAITYTPELNIIKTFNTSAISDHYPFWKKNLKAILLIENMVNLSPYYHTENDNIRSLNFKFFQTMIKSAISLLLIETTIVK